MKVAVDCDWLTNLLHYLHMLHTCMHGVYCVAMITQLQHSLLQSLLLQRLMPGLLVHIKSYLLAILRRMRRMILPERVLGMPGAQWMVSGVAMGPMDLRTAATSSFLTLSSGG